MNSISNNYGHAHSKCLTTALNTINCTTVPNSYRESNILHTQTNFSKNPIKRKIKLNNSNEISFQKIKNLLKEECGNQCDIVVKEAECFDIAWKEWFDSGHEYGARDKEFLDKGLDKILNFILIYVKKNS